MTTYCLGSDDPVGVMSIASYNNHDNSDNLDIQYVYDLLYYGRLHAIVGIANHLELNVDTVKGILNEQMKGVKVTARYGVKAEPKPRLGFTVNNTNEAFVEFLYKGHDITYHLKYTHTITNWTKIHTVAKICSARRYSYEEAEKLLDLVMHDGDKYIEE